jgi:hypothetical protein
MSGAAVPLHIQLDLIVHIRFMCYLGDYLIQPSGNIFSLKQCPIDHCQSCTFSCRIPQCIPVNKQISLKQHYAHRGGKPLQLAVLRRRIHLQYKVHVGCYLFHSDMRLTIYSSGLPASFCNHLPLLFHTNESWIHNHSSEVRADLNQTNRRALHQVCHSLAHKKKTDTSKSTVMLPRHPP